MRILLALFLASCTLTNSEGSLDSAQTEQERLSIEQPVDTSQGAAPVLLPGISMSQGITEITGVAISPLLGLSSVGAWRYFKTPKDNRASLKWYCSPYFWATSLILVALIQLKTFLPKLMSLPLDVADTWEDKISAALVSGTLVPDLVSQVAINFAAPPEVASMAADSFGGDVTLALITFDYRWLFLPLGVASFLVVWMTSHAINLLILLCPFSIVDLGLKFFKVLIVAVLMLSYVINPILGALISLGLIAFTAYLAPKVFRFSYFVTLLSFDLVTPWRSKKTSQPDNAHAFLADGSLGAPRHTYGRIKKTSEGIIIFRYRPRLIMKAKTIELRAETRAIRKGMLYPVILQSRPGHEKLKSVIILPPRYRRIEHLVAENFEIYDVREGAIITGFQGAKIWIKELFSIRPKKQYSS